MQINLVSGTGQGTTLLSAFDNVLQNIGIANTNLIYLSSVIPPNSRIVFELPQINCEDFGKRLYVVMAEQRTDLKNNTIAAGIGWVMEKDNKFGLFVEHIGPNQGNVKKDIKNSLTTMVNKRKDYQFTKISSIVREATCMDKPISVAVCAIYELKDW